MLYMPDHLQVFHHCSVDWPFPFLPSKIKLYAVTEMLFSGSNGKNTKQPNHQYIIQKFNPIEPGVSIEKLTSFPHQEE